MSALDFSKICYTVKGNYVLCKFFVTRLKHTFLQPYFRYTKKMKDEGCILKKQKINLINLGGYSRE